MKTLVHKLMDDKKMAQRMMALLAATIFLAFFTFLYGKFQTAVLQTITTHNNLFVEQVNTISSSLLSNIKTSAMQMFYTSSIKTLRTKEELTNAEKIRGLRDLGNFVSSSEYLDSAIVYNSKADMIYPSDADYPSVKSGDFYDQGAVEILRHPEDYPYLTPIKRERSDGTTWSFLFFEHQKANTNALLINVNDKWYTSHLLGISENSDYIIVDHSGSIIAAADDTLYPALKNEWYSIKDAMEEDPKAGFLLPSAFSSEPGWMYHQAINSGWYYLRPIYLETAAPGLLNIRNFLFASFIILGIVLISFTAYFLVKVYMPLHNIRDVLNRPGESASTLSMEVQQLVNYQHENQMVQAIAQLHNGTLPSGFSFPVLMMSAPEDSAEILKSIIRGCAPLCLIAPSENGIDAAISSCTENLRNTLITKLKQDEKHRFYVSSLCHQERDLTRSHAALNELISLRILYPEQLIFCEDHLDSCSPVSSLKTKEVSALITALKSGEANAAYQQWLVIFSAIRGDHYSDFCFSIRYIVKQLNAMILEYGLSDGLDADELLEHLESIPTLHTRFETLFQAIADASRQKKQEQLRQLSLQINDYIKLHYMESDLSAQQVAEHFQMNAAYLSRQYQKTAQLSISDAIHQIRIRQACMLLKNTDEPVELVAQRVGYNNIKYFFVLFKKWTGCTPRQYRLENSEKK